MKKEVNIFLLETLTLDTERLMPNDFIDPHTGEVVSMAEYKTTKQNNRDINYTRQCIRKQTFYNFMEHTMGEFYFQKYEKLLKVLENDTATAFRFLYVCCFADGEGRISLHEGEYLTKQEEFGQLFNSENAKKYVRDLMNRQLIYKDIIKIYRVNMDYFSLWLPKKVENNSVTRTFKDTIKYLYRISDSKEHKTLGYLVKLLPYVNRYSNTICFNTNKRGKDDIKPLSLQDIVNILTPGSQTGYSVFKKLSKTYVHDELILLKIVGGYEEFYVINPKLFYGSSDITELKGVIEQFEIAKNQNIKKKMTKVK